MKLNGKNNFCSYFLFLYRRGFTFLFLLGFFTASAQIHVSEGTSFVVKQGTSISVASQSEDNSIQKNNKVKIYVKSEKSVKGIADAENYEIIYPRNSESKIAKKSQKKEKTKQEHLTKNQPKEKIPETHRFASFPVPKSCLSNAEGSVDAIVPGAQFVKKTTVHLTVVFKAGLAEITSKLKQNYFWIGDISFRNSNVHSIRPPPVFVII